MTFSKLSFFLLVLFITLFPFIGYNLWWLAHSKKAIGEMWYQGKSYTGQVAHEYSAIKFVAGKDTAWFNTSDDIIFKTGDVVPVRYQVKNHYDAKADIFIEIWGNTLVYGAVLALIIIITFVHPSIIPRKSTVRLGLKKPLVQISRNDNTGGTDLP